MATVLNLKPHSAPTVKTSSYTVPAGRIVKVQPVYADITVDGDNLYALKTLTLNTASSASAAWVYQYAHLDLYEGAVLMSLTVTKGGDTGSSNHANCYFGYGKTSLEITADSATRTNSNGTTTVFTGPLIPASPHIALRVGAYSTTGPTTTGVAVMTYRDFGGSAREFFAPAGTVLDGSRFIVTEYLA